MEVKGTAFVLLLLELSAAGIALAQLLVYPRIVAVDASGNIYVADSQAHVVFKLASEGGPPLVVVRGEGKPRTPLYALSGIAVGPNGELAVSDTASSNVYRIIDGKAVPIAARDNSPFAQPQALTFDSAGDLIVPDLGMQAIFRVKGNQITKIASVEAPTGACVDQTGNIVVVSASHRRLVRIDRQGKVSTIAQGAPFDFPLAVTAHPDGSYIVADGYARALFKVSAEGKVSVLAQGDPFRHPNGIAAEPAGSVVVTDPNAKALFRVSAEGRVSVIHTIK